MSKKHKAVSIKTIQNPFDLMSVEDTNRKDEAFDINTLPDMGTNFQQEEMKNIRERAFMKRVIKKMQSIIALSSPPFRIYEQWQTNDDNQIVQNQHQTDSLGQKIIQLFPFFRYFSVIQGLSILIFLWFISTAVAFQQRIFTHGYLVMIGVQVFNICAKFMVVYRNQSLISYPLSAQVTEQLTPILIITGSTLMLVKNQTTSQQISIIVDIAMIVLFCVLSKNITQYFQIIKVYAQKQKLIKEMRILQLFCILFLLAHVFGLILYSSVYLATQGDKKWIQLCDLQGKPWYIIYIYSIYWATTTIVTVGYGDLTPQNYAQVSIVMVIQICGTSFFGYMINVIGITVDNINKKNQEYDNYQETISKLKENYQLSQQLCSKMKHDIKIKYHQSKVIPLKKNQQIQFLDYVDSTVKKNFILETNIRIIKKSIFFLTYFSVNFQNEVALKLVRVIYKKDEKISNFDETTNQRNIVIINHGKVSIYIEKKQNNVFRQKIVRSIEPIEGKPTLNVFGYSGLILDKDINLYANADSITSGYQLKRSDVLQCIDKSMIDYQNFHQMRERMLLYSIKEAIEAPTLKEPQYHYSPNIFILGCKHSKKFNQLRKKIKRNSIRGRMLMLDKLKAETTKRNYTVYMEREEEQQQDSSRIIDKCRNQFESLLSVQIQETSQPIKYFERKIYKEPEMLLRIDQVKIFEHFMRLHNVNSVSANYQKSCKGKTYKKRILTKYIISQPK